VLGLGGSLQWRRRRRRTAAADPSERILVAWSEVCDALARVGAARRPAETPQEHARRVGSSLGGTDESRLRALAAVATEAGYAEAPLDEGRATETVGSASALERSILATLDRRDRIAGALDPRSLLPRRQRVDIRAAPG